LLENCLTSLLLGDGTLALEVNVRLCGTADFEVAFIFRVNFIFGCFGGRYLNNLILVRVLGHVNDRLLGYPKKCTSLCLVQLVRYLVQPVLLLEMRQNNLFYFLKFGFFLFLTCVSCIYAALPFHKIVYSFIYWCCVGILSIFGW
jgi:hypothetical protein